MQSRSREPAISIVTQQPTDTAAGQRQTERTDPLPMPAQTPRPFGRPNLDRQKQLEGRGIIVWVCFVAVSVCFSSLRGIIQAHATVGGEILYRPIPALSHTHTHTPLRGQKTVNEHTSPNPRPTISAATVWLRPGSCKNLLHTHTTEGV